MIGKFLQYLIPGLNQHLTDDRLERLFCHELSFSEKLGAKYHFARCRHCRLRREKYEERRAAEVLDLYRDLLNSEEPEWSLEPQPEFARRLELHLQHLPPKSRLTGRFLNIPFPIAPLRNPNLVACGVLTCIVASFFIRWQQRVPEMASNALLARAEQSVSSNLVFTRGVMYQSIRITSPKLTIKRSVYRDLEKKRSPRPMKLAKNQQNLKTELAKAGVDWDFPISPSDYRVWHDHQSIRTDNVARVGAHLLKLTTSVPDSSVSSESLTVRDTDFHPVERTVAIRDVGTIEIAELDFEILPMTAVNPDVFEPMSDVLSSMASRRADVFELPRVPQLVAQEQLDEAELNVRLMLNQLHADNGEQIEIHRREQEILVEGVVETDERKKALQTQLRMVPHTAIAIRSEADLKNEPAPDLPTNIQVVSEPNVASPLELLLQKHGRSVSDINVLARRLANAAFTISQESKAIVDLQTRFSADEQLTIVASATLSELIYSHRERLGAALKTERALIAEARITPVGAIAANGFSVSSLTELASKNLALTTELTQTTSPSTRGGEQILTEMSLSVADLTLSSNNVLGKPQGASVLSGKK